MSTIDNDDYIARLAAAVYSDDLEGAKNVLKLMLWADRGNWATSILAGARSVRDEPPLLATKAMPLPWPGTVGLSTLWDVDPASRVTGGYTYYSGPRRRNR